MIFLNYLYAKKIKKNKRSAIQAPLFKHHTKHKKRGGNLLIYNNITLYKIAFAYKFHYLAADRMSESQKLGM